MKTKRKNKSYFKIINIYYRQNYIIFLAWFNLHTLTRAQFMIPFLSDFTGNLLSKDITFPHSSTNVLNLHDWK